MVQEVHESEIVCLEAHAFGSPVACDFLAPDDDDEIWEPRFKARLSEHGRPTAARDVEGHRPKEGLDQVQLRARACPSKAGAEIAVPGVAIDEQQAGIGSGRFHNPPPRTSTHSAITWS